MTFERTSDMIAVVKCKDCAECYDLGSVDPMTPYSGKGDGSFYCGEMEMYFYAPHYMAEAWYCADGVRRNT